MSPPLDSFALVAGFGWLAGAAIGGALYLVGCARGGRAAARAADEVIDDVRRESYAAGWARGYSVGRGRRAGAQPGGPDDRPDAAMAGSAHISKTEDEK